MSMTLCTILNAIVQCAYFTIVIFAGSGGKSSHSEVRGFETIISQRKIFFLHFFHNFYVNIMYIMHTGCSIRNCGLVFTLPIFRQLWYALKLSNRAYLQFFKNRNWSFSGRFPMCISKFMKFSAWSSVKNAIFISMNFEMTDQV